MFSLQIERKLPPFIYFHSAGKDWKYLSNFWKHPFTWRGKQWNTIEHAFQVTDDGLMFHTTVYLLPRVC